MALVVDAHSRLGGGEGATRLARVDASGKRAESLFGPTKLTMRATVDTCNQSVLPWGAPEAGAVREMADDIEPG